MSLIIELFFHQYKNASQLLIASDEELQRFIKHLGFQEIRVELSNRRPWLFLKR